MTTRPFFTTQFDIELYQNEVVYSKLANNVRVAKYVDEHGVARPLIICCGCPIDFRVFNIMVAKFISGRCGSYSDDYDTQLKTLWVAIGYTEWRAPAPNGDPVLRPFWFALPKMMTSIGVTGTNDEDTDILPVLQEISALAKEVLGYSRP